MAEHYPGARINMTLQEVGLEACVEQVQSPEVAREEEALVLGDHDGLPEVDAPVVVVIRTAHGQVTFMVPLDRHTPDKAALYSSWQQMWRFAVAFGRRPPDLDG